MLLESNVEESRYKDLNSGEQEKLKDLLKEFWGFFKVENFEECTINNSSHSRVFRFSSGKGRFILKQHLNSSKQLLSHLNDCQEHAFSKGLKVPRFVLSIENEAFLELKQRLYSLQIYNPGRPFLGSMRDIKEAAETLANFHLCFETTAWEKRVQSRKGDIYPPNPFLYEYLRKGLRSSTFSEGEKILKSLEEFDLLEDCFETLEPNLKKVVGHFDMHPNNLLYNTETEDLSLLLDFDLMRFSERARDVALSLVKLCCMEEEDGKEQDKLCLFLETYKRSSPLSSFEIAQIPALIYDESKRKILHILHSRYFQGDPLAENEIEKQIYYGHKALLIKSFNLKNL
jgi:Ser/Thr protein kinase RdoA (MazF antagonist)